MHVSTIVRAFGHRASILLAGILVGAMVCAQESSLLKRSPFIPPDFNQPAAAPAPTAAPTPVNYLFKGHFELNGEMHFSIFDSTTQRSQWVQLNQQADGFRVVSYDSAAQAVEIDVGGLIQRVSLPSPSDRPLVVASGASPVVSRRPTPNTAPAAAINRRTDMSRATRRVVPPPRINRTRSRTGGNTSITPRTVVRPGTASPPVNPNQQQGQAQQGNNSPYNTPRPARPAPGS